MTVMIPAVEENRPGPRGKFLRTTGDSQCWGRTVKPSVFLQIRKNWRFGWRRRLLRCLLLLLRLKQHLLLRSGWLFRPRLLRRRRWDESLLIVDSLPVLQLALSQHGPRSSGSFFDDQFKQVARSFGHATIVARVIDLCIRSDNPVIRLRRDILVA